MKRVAVLRGGPSTEHAVSLRSGGAVLEALNTIAYPVRDVFISKQGEWLDGGISRRPEQVLEGVDVVFLALHGEYGEDGQVQQIIQRHNIPYTGSRSFPSAFAFNKSLTKGRLSEYGVRSANYFTVTTDRRPTESDLHRISSNGRFFMKPARGGSSLGARIAETVAEVLGVLPEYGEAPVLVEELIEGREATVGVVEGLRGERAYVLPEIEIVPPSSDAFFNYENKYDGSTAEICPGRFSVTEKAELRRLAMLAHEVLDLQQYSRSDFIVKDGEIYFLEVNTLPGLTSGSLLPVATQAVGISFPELVKHLVDTARV